jgi:predicted dehydrogenase
VVERLVATSVAAVEEATRPLRFGLIGTGFWAATVHAPGIAGHPLAELVGVWGRDRTKAATLATRYGGRPFSDVEELIDAVEAVAFAVPPDVQAELAVRAARTGRSLLLEKPLALTAEAADRVVEAVHAPTVVFFTPRFDPGVAAWFRTEIDPRDWDGGSVLLFSSIFEPGNPFGESEWRQERGALWDVGPHALALLLPTLGPVEQVAAVRGRGDEVHLALRHATGAASSVALSLTARTQMDEALFWGSGGAARMPGDVDVAAAYAAAIDSLRAGETPFGAGFARDIVRVLAAAVERLLHPDGFGRRPPPVSA